MGVKTSMTSVTSTVGHIAKAQASGQDATALYKEIHSKIDDLVVALRAYIAVAPNGDANLATLNTQLTALL